MDQEHIIRRDLGNDAYKTADYETAVGHYTLAVGSVRAEIFEKPSKGKLKILLSSYYTSRAAALTKLKQFDEAIADCKIALEFDPRSIKAYQRQARVYMQLGMCDKALETYDQAIQVDAEAVTPERAHTETTKRKFDTAKSIIEKQRDLPYGENVPLVQKAKEDLKTILKFCPSWDEAKILHAEALFYSGENEEAYQLASSLVKNGYSKDRTLLILRSRLMLNKGKIDDAIKQLWVLNKRPSISARSASLKEHVELIKSEMEQADDCYKKRDFQGAINFYSTAIDLCPPEAHGVIVKLQFNRSTAYSRVGAFNLAIDGYTEVLKYDPNHIKAHYRMGSCFMSLNGRERKIELELAIKKFKTALSLCQSVSLEIEVNKMLTEANNEMRKQIMTANDYFSILNVPITTNLAEIYDAYRISSLRIHNYRHIVHSQTEFDEVEDEFQEITEAYEILADACKHGDIEEFAHAAHALRALQEQSSLSAMHLPDPQLKQQTRVERLNYYYRDSRIGTYPEHDGSICPHPRLTYRRGEYAPTSNDCFMPNNEGLSSRAQQQWNSSLHSQVDYEGELGAAESTSFYGRNENNYYGDDSECYLLDRRQQFYSQSNVPRQVESARGFDDYQLDNSQRSERSRRSESARSTNNYQDKFQRNGLSRSVQSARGFREFPLLESVQTNERLSPSSDYQYNGELYQYGANSSHRKESDVDYGPIHLGTVLRQSESEESYHKRKLNNILCLRGQTSSPSLRGNVVSASQA